MLPARLLAWYPKAAIGSGLLEALVAHKDGNLDERILKLVRIQASYSASCAFCIDMNSAMTEETGILPEELLALQGRTEITLVTSFTPAGKTGHRIHEAYISDTVKVSQDFISELKHQFTEREIVILASTAAQVNYWARLIQALGIPRRDSLQERKYNPPVF